MSPLLNSSKETFVSKFHFAVEPRDGRFVVIDRRTEEVVNSAPTKIEAIRIALDLNRKS